MIDYRTMKTGDFVASIPALMADADSQAPTENVIAVAFIRPNGRLLGFAIGIIAGFQEFIPEALASEFKGQDIAARIVLIADSDHAAQGEIYVDMITETLVAAGIPVRSRTHTPAIIKTSPWRDLDSGESGTLPDPAMTPAAIARMIDGEGPIPDPAALEAAFREIEEANMPEADAERRRNPEFARETLAELRETIAEYAEAANHDDTDSGIIGDDSAEYYRARILNDTGESGLASRVGVLADTSQSARDALVGLAVIDIPAAAAIYTHLANQLRETPRTHLLAAAAILLHVDGRRFHARKAVQESALAALAADGPIPAVVRVLMAAQAADAETEIARRFLAIGWLAARRHGIQVPEYDFYHAD
ncbi:hypothetical protein [Nocardia wallacei]|uniref:hypothetical protein n=1 Tax=Nocardia wallacei TaxID=480035 RepID=UPI002457A459|nr:hypothetical protein [Nocardia wallacei]